MLNYQRVSKEHGESLATKNKDQSTNNFELKHQNRGSKHPKHWELMDDDRKSVGNSIHKSFLTASYAESFNALRSDLEESM